MFSPQLDGIGAGLTSWSTLSLITIALISYIVMVKRLRYCRRAEIEAPFASGGRPLSSMTAKEAHEIIQKLQELEFPYAFGKARKLALLKVRQNTAALAHKRVHRVEGIS